MKKQIIIISALLLYTSLSIASSREKAREGSSCQEILRLVIQSHESSIKERLSVIQHVEIIAQTDNACVSRLAPGIVVKKIPLPPLLAKPQKPKFLKQEEGCGGGAVEEVKEEEDPDDMFTLDPFKKKKPRKTTIDPELRHQLLRKYKKDIAEFKKDQKSRNKEEQNIIKEIRIHKTVISIPSDKKIAPDLYQEFRDDNHYYLFMEELSPALHEHVSLNPLYHMITLAEKLKQLHDNGIYHLDLKKENILLRGEGELVICDYGCSLENKEATNILRQQGARGTPSFLAPQETLDGWIDSNEINKIDISSLGFIYLWMLKDKESTEDPRMWFPLKEAFTSKVPDVYNEENPLHNLTLRMIQGDVGIEEVLSELNYLSLDLD